MQSCHYHGVHSVFGGQFFIAISLRFSSLQSQIDLTSQWELTMELYFCLIQVVSASIFGSFLLYLPNTLHTTMTFQGLPWKVEQRGCVFKWQVWAKQAQVYVTDTEQISNPGSSHCGHTKDQVYICHALKPAAQLPPVSQTSMLPGLLKSSRWNSCWYQTTSAKCYNFDFFFLKWNFSKKVIHPTSLIMTAYTNNLLYIHIYIWNLYLKQ